MVFFKSIRLYEKSAGKWNRLAVESARSAYRFFQENEGNIAILSALVLVAVIGLAGGGVDIVRATKARSELNSTLESAALAAASLSNSQNATTVVNEYMHVKFGNAATFSTPPLVTVTSQETSNSKTIDIVASATVDTLFLKIFGVDFLPVIASSQANQSASSVELSLVLDISSSMAGAKLSNLKMAADGFIDQILDGQNINYTSVNLIPFGGSVNIGPSQFNTYAVSTTSAIVDPSLSQYNIGANVLNGAFRFSQGNNCLEHPFTDFDDNMVLPTASRGQVPHFWVWSNFNPWCPEDESAVLFNTNDKTALQDRINELVLSDGTGMDIGAMWGYKALSPPWQGLLGGDFNDRPAAFGSESMKVLVIMTDGNIMPQARPMDWALLNVHTNKPTNHNPSLSIPDVGNFLNTQLVLNIGGASSPPTNNDAVGQFKRICDLAKADGIIVYTIGFQITPGSLAETTLQYCASDPSKYYLVQNLNIQSAFNSIAVSVNALKITG